MENPTSSLSRVKAAGWRAGLLVLVIATFSLVAYGHQQKSAVTRILFNPNTDNIEVMHRFFLHDAEHAATLIFGERQTLLESAESRQLFSSYVMNRFSIEVDYQDGRGEQLALEYVGEEVDGQFLWVYQETAQSDPVAAMTIVNLALRDVWEDQSNLVNVERDGQIFSVTFQTNDDALAVELTP